LTTVAANMQMAKQLQALQQQTAAAVAAATRGGTSSATQQFSVIQNPALTAMAAGGYINSSLLFQCAVCNMSIYVC